MAKPGRREIETAGVPRRGMGCCAYDPRGNRPTAPVQRPLASAAASERNQSEQGWSQEKYRSRFGDVVLEFGTEIISLAFTITSAAQAQAQEDHRREHPQQHRLAPLVREPEALCPTGLML